MIAFIRRLLDMITYPLRAMLSAPGRLLSSSRRLGGLSLPARAALLVAIFLVICAAVTLVAFYHTQNRSFVKAKLTPAFITVVVVLVVLIPLVLYKALKLWLEGETSPFPDIDHAWKAGLAELERQGLNPTQIPIFLVLGSSGEVQEKSLMAASRLSLNVSAAPQGPAALHWYANPEGIYIVATDVGCLSRLSALAAEVFEQEKSRPMLMSPVPSGDALRGTIVAGPGGVGGSPTAASVMRQSAQPVPMVAPPNIRGTMVVGGQAGAGDFEAEGVSAAAEKKVIRLDQHDSGEQQRRLEYLCRLLRRLRQPLCPVNGVLTLLPFGLVQRSVPESIEMQRAVQRDTSTLLASLKARCPVTALVVGLEEESGFRELVRRVGRDRAVGQRFGKGFNLWNPPLPERLEAMTVHACGAFEDWVYTLFREKGSLAKPGNTNLFALLCKVRHNLQSRLVNILAIGYGHEAEQGRKSEAMLFGGCYFAATGETEDRQAFVKAVLDKLPEQQEELQWTEDAYREDQRYQLAARFALAVDTVLLAALAGMIVWKWWL
jgi:hypothetical protein